MVVYILMLCLSRSVIESSHLKAIIFGVCCGLFFGLIFGGIAVIQHFIIRCILWLHGDIPWNYSRFLEEMAERELILKMGGRYHFMHELLREHFTKIQTEYSGKN